MSTPLGAIRRDPDTEDFLEAASRGEFLLHRCRRCGLVSGPQEKQCPTCASPDGDPFPASGGAQVVSWSVVHGRDPDGNHSPQAVVAIGELDEGPWWWTQVFGADPSEMASGRRMRICFEPADGGEMLPVFRLD